MLLGFFIIVLWHKPIDFYQDQIFDKEPMKQSDHIYPDLPTEPRKRKVTNEKIAAAGYYLKVFSGVIKRDVEKVSDYLTRMHFLPRLVRETGIALMNNVYVSTDSSLNVKKILSRLKKDGFLGYVQENPKNHYSIRISSCYYLESAKKILENLKSKGYFGTIVQENTSVKLYPIFLGPYPDLPAVVREQKQLMLRGFPTIIITADPLFSVKLLNNKQ